MPRWENWHRQRLDPNASAEQTSAGSKVLGELMEQLRLARIPTGTLRRRLRDGTLIIASYDGTTPIVQVIAPPGAAPAAPPVLGNLWVPRGFVVAPAYSGAGLGLGLPIIQQGTDPYDPANLAPGLDHTRWTAGGPLYEALLTTDADPGYPSAAMETAPLLYDLSFGPYQIGVGDLDGRATGTTWNIFRMEAAAFGQFFDDENMAEKQALFADINSQRGSAGKSAAYLWPRGYYRPAQVLADIMAANGELGHTSTAYPPTYTTFADRATKEGYASEDQGPPAYDRTCQDQAGEAIANGTHTDAMTTWLADPASTDVIEADVAGQPMFADIGSRAGMLVAVTQPRAAWIEAGRGVWNAGDGRLPPLSWHSFASLNLGFETYPMQVTSDPAQPLSMFSIAAQDANGFWLQYPQHLNPLRGEPALGHYVFLRGRAIAQAPNGGYVLGAGVINVPATRDTPELERLVIIAHHAADNPGAADQPYYENGQMRYVRVWWADVPVSGDLRLRPNQTICGADAADALGWRGGTLFDLGSMPPPASAPDITGVNALKYSSLWRFSPDGSKAIALRDLWRYQDYANLQGVNSTVLTFASYPRGVELVMNSSTAGLAPSLNWLPYPPGPDAGARSVTSLPLLDLGSPVTASENYAQPVAADYDAAGNPIYAWFSACTITLSNAVVQVNYAGTGAVATYPSDLNNLTLLGISVKDATHDFWPTGYFQVADVNAAAFVAEGSIPKQEVTDWSSNTATPNADHIACMQFTGSLVHGVRMFKGGALVAEDWYPCPDGVVFQIFDLCNPGSEQFANANLIENVCSFVQPYYAQRFGQWLFGYQLLPTGGFVRNDATADGSCGCATSIDDFASRTHWWGAGAETLTPRGGRITASFGLPTDLQGAWLMSAKGV